MKINPSPRTNAAVPLEKIAGNPQMSEAEKITQASQAFESLLLKQVLQDAQQTVFSSPLTPQSTAKSIYQDMVSGQLAESISQSGTLGLASSLNEQLQRRTPAPAAETRPDKPALPLKLDAQP